MGQQGVDKMAHQPRTTIIVTGLVVVFTAFVVCKVGLNYRGVCTEGTRVWAWQRVKASDLQAVLQERGTSNRGILTEYSIPAAWEVPGDAYRPASLLDKIRGQAATLVRYHQPWLDDESHLVSTGYLYAPNCIAGWTPGE